MNSSSESNEGFRSKPFNLLKNSSLTPLIFNSRQIQRNQPNCDRIISHTLENRSVGGLDNDCRKRNDEFQARNKQLENQIKSNKIFLYMVIHDLKHPTEAALSLLGTLKDETLRQKDLIQKQEKLIQSLQT